MSGHHRYNAKLIDTNVKTVSPCHRELKVLSVQSPYIASSHCYSDDDSAMTRFSCEIDVCTYTARSDASSSPDPGSC